MPPLTDILWWGLAMALVLEGLIYTLFAHSIHRALQNLQALSPDHLRTGGVIVFALGVAGLYALRALS